ncbi:DUF896 domain-containing protein [Thermoflavimicrobium daqui]|jgi:uncharacterized protein YnzC (UPF0291/DUF896 family)|uniref:UPF0291 protein DL897_14380 n=1 Tax=Thermoflavimicrobium daqui TaxID=2137476 RepID=A0A364K2D9_9BACL|nr:DUF896 domain-containing protein [Thermoflavimicrobium daqui]RAL22592.1 DUF896 family protein [Thermoflavimicrobium daqui]
MIDQKLIQRLNDLAKKRKAEGLTAEEFKEQTELRQIYLKAIRKQVKQQISHVKYVDKN